jgi:hypothetical protein
VLPERGDQCTAGLNFVPARPRRDILQDYKEVLDLSRFDDANERCKVSNQPSRLNALYPSMLPFTTHSTCNGI